MRAGRAASPQLAVNGGGTTGHVGPPSGTSPFPRRRELIDLSALIEIMAFGDAAEVAAFADWRRGDGPELPEEPVVAEGSEHQWAVLVVDDDAMVRRWIREALSGTRMVIAGEAATIDEATALLGRRTVDVLLVDYHLGPMSAVDFIRDLRRSADETPALVFTASPIPGLNELVSEAGGQGCLVKSGESADLLEGLARVVNGETVADPRNPPRHTPRLTARETQVLREIAHGRTNGEIATALGISVNTVKTLQARASAKLGTSRRTETVVAANDLGLL